VAHHVERFAEVEEDGVNGLLVVQCTLPIVKAIAMEFPAEQVRCNCDLGSWSCLSLG
jgi:hypothetical protein